VIRTQEKKGNNAEESAGAFYLPPSLPSFIEFVLRAQFSKKKFSITGFVWVFAG